MRGFFEKLQWRMERFLRGRNGMDDLARLFYYISIGTLVLSLFMPVFSLLTLPFCAYTIFRSLSRNVSRRQRENVWYLGKKDAIRAKLGRGGSRRSGGRRSGSFREEAARLAEQKRLRFEERHEYKFFRCRCGQMLRVRRGQGTKELNCPICHASMTRNTN